MSNENSTTALNVGAAPTGPAREGVIVYLQKVATIGTLAKTLLGFGIAVGAAGVSVYHHFAKTYELRALQCSVIDQNKVNNEVFHAAGEVRSALVLLKTNLDDAGGSPATAKRVAEEMSKSLGNINEALKRIEQMRDNLLVDVSVRGERKC